MFVVVVVVVVVGVFHQIETGIVMIIIIRFKSFTGWYVLNLKRR